MIIFTWHCRAYNIIWSPKTFQKENSLISSSISANNCPKVVTSFKADNEVHCLPEYKLAVSCTAYRTSILLLAERNPGQRRQSPSPSEFNKLEDPSLPSQTASSTTLNSVKQHYRPVLCGSTMTMKKAKHYTLCSCPA